MSRTVTAEVGTSGVFESIELTTNPGADIARAVALEHPCRDDSCDIARALEEDCPYASAYLLSGATETPLLDAVLAAHGLAGLAPDNCPDWDDWIAAHNAHGVRCDGCGSFTYGDDFYRPEVCGNCLAPLPAEEEPEED